MTEIVSNEQQARIPPLSSRLRAIVDMLPACETVCDIGTDHALVPVALVLSGKCERAIAADIGEGPLSRARAQVEAAGLTDRIALKLSDGFKGIGKDEAVSAVITGMGGRTIRKILAEGRADSLGIKTLLVSPQSEPELVRSILRDCGFILKDEAMVAEDDKYYPLILAVRSKGDEGRGKGCKEPSYEEAALALTAYDSAVTYERADRLLLRYGPVLLKRRDPVLFDHLERERQVAERIMTKLSHVGGGDSNKKRIGELEETLADIGCLRDVFYKE